MSSNFSMIGSTIGQLVGQPNLGGSLGNPKTIDNLPFEEVFDTSKMTPEQIKIEKEKFEKNQAETRAIKEQINAMNRGNLNSGIFGQIKNN